MAPNKPLKPILDYVIIVIIFMIFILINLFFVFIVIFALIILWWVWPPDSPWSPWWRTSSKKALAAAKLAKINSKDIVYELGSGDANFLVAVCKKTGAQGVGIEIDAIRCLTAKLNILKNKVSKRVAINRGNFFDYKLSSATIVFVYLVPRVLENLKPKLFKELKKGTKIISYKYKFKPNKKLKFDGEDKKNEMYLYKII